MITLPNGKICLNEQEAIQWLLDNYPVPFQCSANYVGGAEIGLGTIVNPTPAKVKVGSIIFFADSKVSTVVAVNSTSFVCSEEYNDLVDDVVYVSNVQLNASGHLIVTLSNNTNIDAGLIKQVSSFSINASQHLIVSYNDGTSTDLGAIFNGNISISGNLTVSGGISGNAITGDSIVENMSGYSYTKDNTLSWNDVYVSAVKNGNKVTFVVFGTYTKQAGDADSKIMHFLMPNTVGAKLYPYTIGTSTDNLDNRVVPLFSDRTNFVNCVFETQKQSDNRINILLRGVNNLTNGTEYLFRYEVTFLLSDPLPYN